MTAMRWVAAVGLAVVVWLLVAAFPVTSWGAPSQADLERLDNSIGAFMESRGYEVPELPVTVAPQKWFDVNTPLVDGYPTRDMVVAGAATPAGSVINKRFLWWLGRPDYRPYMVELLVHEKAHQRSRDTRPGTATSRWVEEAIVDAVARDITPMYLANVEPHLSVWWLDVAGAYERGVSMVRTCSARRTGRPWFSSKAREWRRGLWRAEWEQRFELLRRCGVRV